MNIFIFVTLPFTRFIGGVESVLLNFAQEIEKTEHKIYFIGLVYDEEDLKKDVIDEFKNKHLIRIRIKNDKKVRFIRSVFGLDYSSSYTSIAKSIKSIGVKPDVILEVGAMLPPDIKKALKELKMNVKVVSWVHINLIPYPSKELKGKINDFFLRWIRKRRLKYADAHLAISNGMKDQILSLVPNAKVYVVFNPLKNYNGELVRRSDKHIFIYVGRLDDYQKNISFLLRSMSKINKEWKLILIGRGGNEKELKDLAYSLGISQKIEWRGFKKNPYENLNEGVTALLLTSRFESFGLVLAEANQRGIPVISSDCQVGPSDIVIQGVNGYLYPEGDMDAFVKIINDMIDGKLGFGTPEEIAKTAERFSGEAVCNNIINALKDITGKE